MSNHENLISREAAKTLLKQYNTEEFHLLHAETVAGVMRYFARLLGYGGEEEYWGIVGLLHDIDYEQYPDEHCQKAPELLRSAGISEEMIYSICSHGYQVCSELEPLLEMEKVLYAVDELTGLIGAAARMRPSKSTADMELSSLRKKYKDKRFAAGCNRDTIAKGAAMLGWELDELLEKTILAMREVEASLRV
ncbi:MAG: hydrolase [Lachnospiraceae bacterium]|jgi:predicted hydrolase (HD superfamily)|nr:hydrolase [Lachnospiraceae bacterium]